MQQESNMEHEPIRTDLFYRIADHLADGDTLDEVLASVVDFAVRLAHCDECYAYVRKGTYLVPWVSKHVAHPSLDRAALPIDSGFAAALSSRHAPIAVSDKSLNSRHLRSLMNGRPTPERHSSAFLFYRAPV